MQYLVSFVPFLPPPRPWDRIALASAAASQMRCYWKLVSHGPRRCYEPCNNLPIFILFDFINTGVSRESPVGNRGKMKKKRKEKYIYIYKQSQLKPSGYHHLMVQCRERGSYQEHSSVALGKKRTFPLECLNALALTLLSPSTCPSLSSVLKASLTYPVEQHYLGSGWLAGAGTPNLTPPPASMIALSMEL